MNINLCFNRKPTSEKNVSAVQYSYKMKPYKKKKKIMINSKNYETRNRNNFIHSFIAIIIGTIFMLIL